MSEKMNRSQTGFVSGMTTHVNIMMLLGEIKRHIELCKINRNKIIKRESTVIFIDFQSAYNTILREKIYKRLEDKNILLSDEIEFLR